MKFKHNKKRNTALLYEYLVKELTRSVLKEDVDSKEKIVFILREFFQKNSILRKELEIYKSISDPSSITKNIAEKVLNESKKQFERLDKQKIFQEQTKLLKEISSSIKADIFSNFVPHYKNLATIYQLFNSDADPKRKVLLEEKVIETMTQTSESNSLEIPVQNNLVFRKFIEGFNKQYGNSLLNEQKELLNKYIVSSFSENALELKVYLNEELGRIKNVISSIKEEDSFKIKADKIFEAIEQFKKNKVDINSIKKVLHLQQLAGEIQNNGD
tara:strand:+ start:5159 stop:5974 length:816 start_codon:yes stop_codon:yes gene_type:complete